MGPGPAAHEEWAPPPWPPAPTEQIPPYDGAPPAKPPLDTVSLFALITAVPGLGLVSVPLGIWRVIRTKNGTGAPGYSETHAHPRTNFQPTVAELWNWGTGVLSHQI